MEVGFFGSADFLTLVVLSGICGVSRVLLGELLVWQSVLGGWARGGVPGNDAKGCISEIRRR